MSIRKIIITSLSLIAVFLIYLIPDNNYGLSKAEEHLEYVSEDLKTSPVYLLNDEGMLTKTAINITKDENEIALKAKELLNILIVEGSLESRIPSGFKGVIPSDTEILSVKYTNEVLKVDFSKELLDVPLENEEKVVEAIVYTLTSIDKVDKIIIYVEGDILTKLPKSKKNLPSTLNRSFGINKQYNLKTLKNINHVTVYYNYKVDNQSYYVPVTKYLNDDREKIEIIIDELTSHSLYGTNLMSYLNDNTELLKTSNEDGILNLTFNNYIFDDINEQSILEEVIYTICLSVEDNYDVNQVVFKVGDQEIYKSVLKTIE